MIVDSLIDFMKKKPVPKNGSRLININGFNLIFFIYY